MGPSAAAAGAASRVSVRREVKKEGRRIFLCLEEFEEVSGGWLCVCMSLPWMWMVVVS